MTYWLYNDVEHCINIKWRSIWSHWIGSTWILLWNSLTIESYAKGAIPGSINIPFPSAFSPEGDLNPCAAVNVLNQNKPQVKVIVGSRGKNASNVSTNRYIVM